MSAKLRARTQWCFIEAFTSLVVARVVHAYGVSNVQDRLRHQSLWRCSYTVVAHHVVGFPSGGRLTCTRRLTSPSSGRPPAGFASFRPPLMSDVRCQPTYEHISVASLRRKRIRSCIQEIHANARSLWLGRRSYVSANSGKGTDASCRMSERGSEVLTLRRRRSLRVSRVTRNQLCRSWASAKSLSFCADGNRAWRCRCGRNLGPQRRRSLVHRLSF